MTAKYRIKPYPLDEIKPGMEIGRMVLTRDKKIVLSEGTILSQSMIEGLKFWDISTVFIKELLSDEPDIDFSIPETLQQKSFMLTMTIRCMRSKSHLLKYAFSRKCHWQLYVN